MPSHLPDPAAAPFAWGIVGPGAIAGRFADAVRQMPDATVRAVWGRDARRASEFAQRHPGGRDAPTRIDVALADLLADPAIDAVYIATPHDSHASHATACLQAGKAVLCEKPLTPTARQTQALIGLARSQGVFLMEAMWTFFLPVFDPVRDWLRRGLIGEPRSLTSTFCFDTPYRPDSRLFSPALAGGTLLDIGIYNLAVTRLVLAAAHGRCPEALDLQASGTLAPTGVDQQVDAVLRFDGGACSTFRCSFMQRGENAFHIVGSHGEIRIEPPFWEATRACLLRPGQPPEWTERSFSVNGFEYEIREAMRAVRAGEVESPVMPHDETRALVRWIDELRRQLGVRYPFETEAR